MKPPLPNEHGKKPQLPNEIRKQLPPEIVHHIQSFVPPSPKLSSKTPSPSLQKELQKIQVLRIKGTSPMFMKELEDFCLD